MRDKNFGRLRGVISLLICRFALMASLNVLSVESSYKGEPFLYGFGPSSGDQYIAKGDDICSEKELSFGGSCFMLKEKRVCHMHACVDGTLNLVDATNFNDNSNLEGDTTDLVGNPKLANRIAIAMTDADTEDRLLDYMCRPSQQSYYYSSLGYNVENACDFYSSSDGFDYYYTNLAIPFSHYNPENYRLVYQWNYYLSYVYWTDVDIQFDDDLTLLLMGVDDTKYPNLAGNVFFRKLDTKANFDTANELIGGDFDAKFGFVVTYYKIQEANIPLTSFNSYQFVLVCDNSETPFTPDDDMCYAIFDYFEIQFGSSTGNFLYAGFYLSEEEPMGYKRVRRTAPQDIGTE